MNPRILLTGMACLLPTLSVAAQQTSPTALMGACYQETDGGGVTIGLNVDEAGGPGYFLQVSIDNFASLPILLGPFPLDAEGNAVLYAPFDPSVLPPQFKLGFRAVFKAGGYVQATNKSFLVLNDEGCEMMDVDLGAGAVPLLAGEVAGEQWAPIGMHLSGTSQLPLTQPNKCIIFDSSNPTGNDPDLATPGYGPGNTVAWGKLLIMAENDVDADNDGFVDDPDDAFNGGLIHFNFDQAQTICSVTLVDIDDHEPDTGITKLRFYEDNAGTMQISAITVPAAGDNSVQTLLFRVDNVRRMDVKLGGSGGVPRMAMCPTIIDFDQTTFGLPLTLAVGEQITTQFQGNGFTVSADNARPGGPDKAIIFDSANPTGGDPDLATPGYGPGNTLAEGKILIIAENDVDGNGDGLVDSPDDEAQGGRIFFDFDFAVRVLDVTVLDVDGLENSFVECRDVNNLVVDVQPLATLGANSRQTVSMNGSGVRHLVVKFGGSGAVTDFRFCPEP